ncbi:MAG TPA: DUF6152 family protein [Gammaproteobacteria bacterium]|nr:DUF6152 family protein [Gammaproteobacteria bacterium]
MKARCVSAVGMISVLLLLPAARAHHSFAVYDFSRQIEFVGTVDTLNFKNPHIAMTLRVTDEDGESVVIDFIEGAPANMLARNGLRPDMIAPGTKITAVGSPLIDDPSKYFLRNVILEDGREFVAVGR